VASQTHEITVQVLTVLLSQEEVTSIISVSCGNSDMRFRRLITFVLMCLGIDTEHQPRQIEQFDPQVLAYILELQVLKHGFMAPVASHDLEFCISPSWSDF
jgi:hypothetical protein